MCCEKIDVLSASENSSVTGIFKSSNKCIVSEKLEKLAEIRFESCPKQLCNVRRVVRSVSRSKGCGQELINSLVLAIDEASSNVIKHAYGLKNSGDIILEIFYSRGELVFRLTDFASPVDRAACCSRELDDLRPGGLGVHLIRKIMDNYEFLEPPEGVGNILEMRKRIANV